MPDSDRQSAACLVHVCGDALAGSIVEQAAVRAGWQYRRAADGFAAALDLLTTAGPNTALLLALDSMAKVELGVAAWAAARWPDMPIWAHGSPDRLNGRLAESRMRIIQLAELDRLFGEGGVKAIFPDRPEAAPAPPAGVESAAPQPEVTAGPPPGESGLKIRRAPLPGPLLTPEELAALLDPQEAADG